MGAGGNGVVCRKPIVGGFFFSRAQEQKARAESKKQSPHAGGREVWPLRGVVERVYAEREKHIPGRLRAG